MEKREKCEFILEQMRLCLAHRDFVRTQILSKKISIKVCCLLYIYIYIDIDIDIDIIYIYIYIYICMYII